MQSFKNIWYPLKLNFIKNIYVISKVEFQSRDSVKIN